MTTIAVIGGGFSGTMAAMHLLAACPAPVRVLLIDDHRFGLGQAYATRNPHHLLNVPAGRMSAYADRPDHFVRWLADRRPDGLGAIGAADFAPRMLYGRYLRGLLAAALAGATPDRSLRLIRGTVSDVLSGDVVTLRLDRDRTIDADFAVMALGNFAPEPVRLADPAFYATPLYRNDCWSADAVADLPADAPVLLIGTGLTMVDMVMSLQDAGHRGVVHALSRHGLLPGSHIDQPSADPLPAARGDAPTALSALSATIRREIDAAQRAGLPWQKVIDRVRPITADLWQACDLDQRRRFLRHLRRWWDIHRHRIAAPVAGRIGAAIEAGRLRIHAGSLRGIEVRDDEAVVRFQPRCGTDPGELRVARVINCSGPGSDYGRIPDRLLQSLLRRGAARPDALRLGFDVTAAGALRRSDGGVSRTMFALGPVTKGVFWEMVAVPDIRAQAETLARHVADIIRADPGRAA